MARLETKKRGELEQALPRYYRRSGAEAGRSKSTREAGAKTAWASQNGKNLFGGADRDRRFRFGNATLPPAFPPAQQNAFDIVNAGAERRLSWHDRCSPRLRSAARGGPSVPFRSGRRRNGKGTHLKLAPSLELYSYWDALRGARSAPERNDIEPGAIRGVLADTFILEISRRSGFSVPGRRQPHQRAVRPRIARPSRFSSLWRREDARGGRAGDRKRRRRRAAVPYRRARRPRRRGGRSISKC